MADTWFETVAFAQEVAKKSLPKPVYAALLAASEKGVTVENVLDVLRGGIDSALMGLGSASILDVVASDVLVPPGFTRALGLPTGPDA